MPGFSTALYRPSVQNFVGGLEGDAGGAANYLGAFAKSQGEIDPDTGWNSLGDWFINNGTYWNDRADDVQQQFGTLNRYQNEGILQRLTDTDYLTDSRGLMADVFNGAGSSVPFIVTGALTPEIGIGGALARGAGGLLERMGMSTAGRAVASDLVQSGANDFARYALTGGPLEAAINAGGIYDDLKNQGLSDSEIFGKMNSMIGEELPVDMLTSGLYGAVLGGNTFSRLGQGGWKRAIAANALNTPADMLGEYMQEMTQQQLQNKYSGKPYGTFWNPTEDEMQAGRAAAMGALPMGMFGSARGAINSRRAAMAAADGGSVTGPEPVTPPAVPDPNVDPVAAAQLEGKNDDVPTADGVDVTNLDPQQYTQWYGEKLKSQGIDVPDATITVQTPKATGATGGAKAGAGANVMDAAQDFMGQHMENGANGCVEAVTKIGARYNPFLADELSKGVVNVDTLVADAGDKVIPFDPNNLEAGDVIVYGDNDHVVLADGNGGYVGNSSSQQKVVQGGDYNNMGGLKPTKIIKTGNGVTAQNETANNGGAPAADLSSLPVGSIATAIAQNTGLPANFIWAQLSHESDGGNSKLAREDHNYGGVKGNDGEYLHFDNDQQFIDYMSDYYPKYREDGIYDAKTADQFAEALQHGGYFTAGIDEYEGGMHRYLEQAGLSDSGTAGAPSEKQSNANTMTAKQFGDMLDEKMIDFAGTNDDTVKTVFNDMSTSKDKALVSLFAQYMQDGVFANTAANRTALANDDGFKKAMSMFLSKHLSDYAPAFENGKISFQQAEEALRPRHQVQAAQTAQAVQATQTPNIKTVTTPKVEATTIQNVLSSFVQDKKNVARTEQEANLFDDMLDADDHFIDTPKNRQTLLKNYGAQLQDYVDDAMTPSLTDRVNQAIEQAVQNKDLNRMNTLTQAKQANDTAALEKLVGLQTKQHVDIAAMLTPANTDMKNHVSSMVQANMPVDQTPTRMDDQQTARQSAPKEQADVTPLPTQKGQHGEGVRIAQPQQTIDEQNAQTDARIAEIKKTPLAQRKALGQQYLDTLRQNNVSFSEKKLAKSLMNGDPGAIEHVQRTYGDMLNTITPAEAAAASQHAPRTIQAATTARLGNMVSEITSGNTYKNASPVGKLAYLSAASAHAKTIGADKSARAINSIIADVRKKAGFSGKGTTEGMTPEQKDEFYNAFYKQSLDDAMAIRKEAADEKPANLKSLDNTIEMFKQELANSKPTKEERKEVAHESTQSKSQNEPDKGTKNQDQHAKPEPRKTADTQREAEESEVSTTKKAADNGGKYVLADGYRTESGKPLLESGENEFILKPNGSKDFGEITDAISKAAKEQSRVDLAPGKIRLRVGNDKEGLIHAKKHEEQANADGYTSIEDMIADVAENFDSIYAHGLTRDGHTTYSLIKHGNKATGKMNGVAPVYLNLEDDGHGNYYVIVTAIPKGDANLARQTKKDRLIYSSQGLGAATESNAGAVSTSAKNVGAETRGGTPTSDKSSGSSTHIIPHEQKEGTKNLDTGKVPAMGEPIHGIKGTETTVVTDSGKEIRVRYRVVPASRVITSYDAETMTPNKEYPQELQPRDRQRVSMQEQVTTMANELRPADLGAGRNLNQGAPVIRKDGVVLNGNGRAMAIQKATASGGDKATAYRKYIFEHSKEFGISRSNLSQMRKYMLVREVVDDIDADTMQDIIGSTAGGSRMGASEQAKADAKKIRPRELIYYVDNEQGDLTTAANQDFVARVLYRIVGKNERNAYTDEHGNVNADGIQRVKRALFSLAYNDDGLIDKMAESTDDNIRNVSRGLMSAAPAFARVNLAVKDGQAYEYDAAKTISDAVKHLDALRREGKPVKDYLNEQSMFSEYQDTDEVREVLRFLDENKRSGKKIGIFLNDMARSILEQGSPNQTSLMDGGRATLGEIIKAAERVARDGTTAASLFGNEEGSHVDVARSKASVQGDLKKIGKRVVFLPDNSLTSREKGIKEFGEKMGLKVVFFEGPSNLHGMYENGVSFINRSSSTSAPWTFWHETFHWLRHNNPELYRQMVSYIGKKQAFSSEQLQAYRDKTGRQALSDADVIEEMLADAMPDVHKRVSLFRNLGKADAPLLQRFVGWLRDAMRAFHDALTGRKAGLSETQKAAMRDALANIAADLRDSNGKHIFKVSGAEREITAADGTKLSYPARFSGKQETPTIFTAEDRLKADKKAWKGTLRKAWKGDMPDTTMLPVMQTPLVLKLVGAPDYPMVMRQSKLMKIKKDHPEVTKAILNELPSYLADPMIIFKSSTVSGRLVVGTELEDASGANIIVPIELNSKDGRMDVNVITSVYGKGTQQSGTNIAWFVNNIQAGNAVYINKKQAADFYQSAGLQLPMEGRRFNDLFGSSIKTDADLVKSRRENPVRYSLDANDNSTPSLFTRAYNHLTGRKDAASHDKNVKAMLEDITKMRIRFGKFDPATEIVFKKFEGVIRARNANEWEKVLPEAGRAIADRLNLKPSEDMNNYIAKWLLDEATNDTSQEASDFAAALKNDPVLSDQLVDLKTLFNERNNREADEVVRDAIQYEKPKERTTLTKAWETFYDEMIEELGPVKRMVKRVQEKSGQELAASVNPYIALRLFRGNAGRAMTMIEGQSEAAVKALQTNYPGVNFNGFKTLHMILDECGALHNEKRMKDFLAFALACHVKDIHTLNNRIRKSQQRLRDKIADLNDKINNLPEYQQLIESDKKVDDKYQEQREAYQKEIEGYQAKIDKAEKTIMEVPRTEDGLSLTEDRCNKVMMKYMKEYGEAQQDLVHFSKVTTSILYDAGVISKKRYKELQERWPNYIPMFRVFEDNEEVDFGDSLKPMHGSTRRIINPLDSIIRNTYDFVKKAERNKARQLLADLTRISDVGEYIEEVDNAKPNDKTTITFYENGERKYLQTDPDIVKAVNNMGREESNWVLRLLHGPAKIARACFTTINPSFALRNLIRDSTDATIYSKYGFKPWDFVRGFLHAVHRDELFYEWLSSGAAQASAISLDRDYTQATLNQMSKTWKERLLSKEFLPAILEGMQMVGEYSEYGTRIAAYERVKKTLAGENGPHPAAYDLVSAAFESRDLMDFARGGRGSRYLNNVVVFANASIQGFDKFFRTFDFRKPYRKESMKALARLFLCGMLPALLLAGIHSGDDWWEELPDWQKETNWILGKVGNTIIRIPKGQDIGLRFFSNLIEKAMDRSKHKAGDYFRPVWDSLPDMIPTALLPIIEATANHSYFTGAPVVPKYQEKLPAYLQFGNETSSFAKFVGKVIGVSPRKVEHVLFGYTGNMGKGLLGVYDTIVGNQSLNTNLNEAPVISGFTAIPYKQSKTVNDFYDKFDEQQRLNEEFKLTKKKPDGYDPSLYKRMTKAQQELSKINKQERAAIDDPKMDSGVREQKQLGYQQQRLSVVRRVMGH
ncbi:LPD38 domain-containing protein [Mitsuokella jalaludinii]|uniref:LPD38 domain-containing protein n=1 Tax=Mitsuokella jalaludinii TaxID=187979 RepID=UPI003079E5DE